MCEVIPRGWGIMRWIDSITLKSYIWLLFKNMNINKWNKIIITCFIVLTKSVD